MSQINGLFIYGTTMLANEEETFVSKDPMFLPAEMVERGIADGTLQAGIFSNVKVQPSVEQWPPEWRHLKE